MHPIATPLKSWIRNDTDGLRAIPFPGETFSLNQEVEIELATLQLHEGERPLDVAVGEDRDRPRPARKILDGVQRVAQRVLGELAFRSGLLQRLEHDEHAVIAHA